MILAFKLVDIVQVPFGYLLSWLNQLTTNYGVALILFAIILKLILFPATAKSKKSSMKMSRLTPRIQALQKKYANDQQKLNEATQALYKEEGVSMGGGCLWSFLPLLILIPLYTVVRQPIQYMLHESAEVAGQIVEIIKTAMPEQFGKNEYYHQMIAAPLIPQFADQLKDIVTNPATLEGLNFSFLHLDLGAVPQFNVFQWETWDWSHIGAFLMPVLSAGSQVISMLISQKMNNSLVTNENGVQDKEAAKNSTANQSTKTMLFMMPLMSLWIGFTVPGALSLYWLVQGLVSMVLDIYLTKKYRTLYDAEDAERLKRAMEQDAIEEEKERIRAERRAANPDGITTNTSKKKLQQQQQKEQEEAKAAAAKEYAIKKGLLVEEEDTVVKQAMSGVPSRPYCKGRNYDPNRYASQTTEE
ncbi:MAG: YidC/Oxa1 family membrane protein insertase [Oscillospiraceae bacterium]|nr:YidC/Oxa1 family membrane protein insertase [Oscillospiraceae bacterium]